MGDRGPHDSKPKEPWEDPYRYIRMLAEIVDYIDTCGPPPRRGTESVRPGAPEPHQAFFKEVDGVIRVFHERYLSGKPPRIGVRWSRSRLRVAVALAYHMSDRENLLDFAKAHTGGDDKRALDILVENLRDYLRPPPGCLGFQEFDPAWLTLVGQDDFRKHNKLDARTDVAFWLVGKCVGGGERTVRNLIGKFAAAATQLEFIDDQQTRLGISGDTELPRQVMPEEDTTGSGKQVTGPAPTTVPPPAAAMLDPVWGCHELSAPISKNGRPPVADGDDLDHEGHPVSSNRPNLLQSQWDTGNGKKDAVLERPVTPGDVGEGSDSLRVAMMLLEIAADVEELAAKARESLRNVLLKAHQRAVDSMSSVRSPRP